ncbi:MAG: hypothetical protein ACREOO_13690 [bacterium]
MSVSAMFHATGRLPRIAALAASVTLFSVAAQKVEAQVTFNLQLIPSQIYFISDFDVNGTGGASDLFKLNVTNNNAVAIQATLRMFLTSSLSSSSIVDATILVTLNPGPPQTFTYRNFRGQNAQVISFTYNASTVGQITDAVARTGRLPSGTYFITVQVRGVDGTPLQPPVQDQVIPLIISNPITLDLISPGQIAGQAECPMVFSNLPQFTWNSDANRFLLTICEKLPSNTSPEDVMQNPPRLQRTLSSGQDFFGTPSFLYPSTGLPLQPGRVYYWQITALTTSTSGEVRLPGEIWCFQVQGEMGGDRALRLQELLSLLASLGLDDVADLFAAGGPLEGYLPTGRVIINGQIVDLNELFITLRGGTTKIKSFTVE